MALECPSCGQFFKASKTLHWHLRNDHFPEDRHAQDCYHLVSMAIEDEAHRAKNGGRYDRSFRGDK